MPKCVIIEQEYCKNFFEYAKTHWNSIKADGNVPDDVVKELLDKSYDEILNKLTKKKRAEILSL